MASAPVAQLGGQNIHANGIRQHVLRYGGSGPALLLLPGITSPAVTWGFVAERLARDFDTYVLDIRGRGLSQAGPGLDYSLDAMAADAAAVAEALKLEDLTLVGHSMGARIALRSALRLGHRLRKLVLIDPPVSGPGSRRYPTPLAWYLDALTLARAGAGMEALRRFTPSWSDAHLQLRAEWLHTCEEAAVMAAYDGFHTDNIHADFQRLPVPTLLIAAGKGDVILPEDLAKLRAAAPGMKIERIETAGHMIPFDDYDGFFGVLDTFLLVPGENRQRVAP